MTGSTPLPPINATGQLVQSLPGFDPAPVIAAGDQRLSDYLAMPTQQILDQLGLQRLPTAAVAAPTTPGVPANPGGPISPVGPAQLISPVINALGTLGSGQFSGMDPTSMLNGISNAFNGTSGPVQQALSAVAQGWQGASNASAAAKTGAALANGAEVATQATGLQSSLSAAVADVAQAQTQLIAIVNEFFATVAAIGPNIIFPWGWAAVLAAAAQAITQAAQVVTEVQSSLGAKAGAVSAIGAPVNVATAPQLGSSMGGPLSSLLGGSTGSTTSPMSAMSTLSPLMSAATMGLSPAMSAASMAGQGGGASSAATGTLAGARATDPKAGAAGAALVGKSGGAGASVSPAGGGGGAASGGALVSRVTPPMPPAAAETATTAMSAAIRPTTGGMPMTTGAGMMGAPLAGANSAGGAHSAASYLHTSDQGGKVVSDRSTVAPPVIGEADPNDTPDIELRI
jgi:hypothetical protein